MEWSQQLAQLVWPDTAWVETCCGPTNVRAAWFQGRRLACGCWQRVCPLRHEHFWPAPSGGIHHRHIRSTVRRRCGIDIPSANIADPVVRILERPEEDGRQFEDRAALMEAVRRGAGARSVQVRRMSLHKSGPNGTLCEQVRWFANAHVIIVAHGAATTNAIFADPGALIIDVLPFAYRHEPSAPSDYYAALLLGTDVRYMQMSTIRPRTQPLQANRMMHLTGLDAGQCQADKDCRLAYRDHCCMRLDAPQLEVLQGAIARHLAPTRV